MTGIEARPMAALPGAGVPTSPPSAASRGAGSSALASPLAAARPGADPIGTSRARIRAALDHRAPDRIPFDLGGSRVTGIHLRAYAGLREALGLPAIEPQVGDLTQQLAEVDADVADLLGCDVRAVGPRPAATYRREIADDGEHRWFRDEWGVGRRMPRDGGLYYDSFGPPLAGEVDVATIDRFAWPDALDPARFAGMADAARRACAVEGRAVHVGSICGGLTEGLFKLRGFEDGYMDLAAAPARARRVMERILEIKIAYWGRILPELGGLVDVVGEADDLGGQDRPLFSPATYRALVKPLQRELFSFIHARTSARVFFHTCGAVRDLLPDLIEIGVDILNPLQVSATGMATAELKRDFGRDLVFWGGGVDTQRDPRHGDARRGPGRGPAPDRGPALRRRLRLRGRPQRAAERAAGEPPRDVGGVARGGRGWLTGRSCAAGSCSTTGSRLADSGSRTGASSPSSSTRARSAGRTSARASSTSTSTAGAATTRWARRPTSTAWRARSCATASLRSCRRP